MDNRPHTRPTTAFISLADFERTEIEAPFSTVEQLADFILDMKQDRVGYKILRGYILDFAYFNVGPTDWSRITRELQRYPELPHRSLERHGLSAVFHAAMDQLNGYTDCWK